MLFPSQESRIGVNTQLLSEDSTEDATLSEPNICITQRANQFTWGWGGRWLGGGGSFKAGDNEENEWGRKCGGNVREVGDRVWESRREPENAGGRKTERGPASWPEVSWWKWQRGRKAKPHWGNVRKQRGGREERQGPGNVKLLMNQRIIRLVNRRLIFFFFFPVESSRHWFSLCFAHVSVSSPFPFPSGAGWPPAPLIRLGHRARWSLTFASSINPPG